MRSENEKLIGFLLVCSVVFGSIGLGVAKIYRLALKNSNRAWASMSILTLGVVTFTLASAKCFDEVLLPSQHHPVLFEGLCITSLVVAAVLMGIIISRLHFGTPPRMAENEN